MAAVAAVVAVDNAAMKSSAASTLDCRAKVPRCSRVAASVEKKKCVLGGRVDTVVVGKLQHWQVLVPVIMQRVHKVTQHLLNGAVSTLSLTVCLRVVAGGDFELGTQVLEDGLPEVGGEPRVSVRDDGGGQAVKPVNLPDEQSSSFNSTHRLVGRNEMALLGEPIHKSEDGIKTSSSGRHVSDEVQRYTLPGCRRFGQRLQLASLQCM